VTVLREAFEHERAQLRAIPSPEPVLAKLGRFAARLTARWPKLRSAVLQIGGLGCLSAAAWEVNGAAGLAATGLSLFVLEYLSSGSDKR
jgi:hypothetical protein